MNREKIRILLLAANPGDTERLALDSEVRGIERAIRLSEYRDSIEMRTGWAVEPDDIIQLLHEHKPHIVHFSGHGVETGELIFQEQGMAKPLTAEQLQQLFRVCKDNIQVVILNACYSYVQAQAIGQEIDYVIGMKEPIEDRAAIRFAGSFYRAIGFGKTVPRAFEEGTLLHENGQENVPELYVRGGVTEHKPIQVGVAGEGVSKQQARAVRVFSLYAKRDKKHYDQLSKQFAVMRHQKLIEDWSEQDLKLGDQQKEISLQKLNEADVILLFISGDFLETYELYGDELRQAVKRHQEKTALIVPIRVQDVAGFEETEIGGLVTLPRKEEKPLGAVSGSRQGVLYALIAGEIRELVKKLREEKGR